MTELIDYLHRLTDDTPRRPVPPRVPTTPPGPAPQVNACALAHAARDAVRDVLPAEWQHLPDGTETANVLAGTLANHYAAQQQAQAERLAAAGATDAEDGHG